MGLIERNLAEEARELVSQFDFNLRTPRRQSQLESAKNLYRRIFYEKDFKRSVSIDMDLTFNANIFPKITNCKQCAKIAYMELRKFANWVLD